MKMSLFLALVLTLALALPAAAVPTMLSKGHKSFTFEANPDNPVILFGWNIAEMTKFNIGGGLANKKAPQTVVPGQPSTETDSNTSWEFQAGMSRYMGAISNSIFAPMIGARVAIRDNGSSQDTSFGVRGFFGVEAFVVESLSIGGNIGINYDKDGDTATTIGTPPTPATIEGGTSFTTTSSSILATLYW